MADLIRHMEEGHETADIDGVIDEVAAARGTYDTLDDRLDAMGGAPSPSSSTPAMDGTASAGESDEFARGDHVHPRDTTKQDTLAFEGTYNASTNKVATMSAVKDGKLAGYAQTSGNVAETDKIIEAIGKVEKKADDNKTNILIEELTDILTVETGYEITTVHTHIYKQGKHIFGEIQIEKKDGYYSTASPTIATIAAAYIPKYQYLGVAGFGTGKWSIIATGAAFISETTGEIMVDTPSQNNNFVMIQISYIIN